MSTNKEQFLNYELLHNYTFPNEPLKSWINEDNFHNIFEESYDRLFEIIIKIETLISKEKIEFPFLMIRII